MAQINEQEVLRKLLAALIGSTLSMRELQYAAEQIQSGSKFSWALSKMLRHVSDQIGQNYQDRPHYDEDRNDGLSGLSDLAIEIVKRRRLSKERVLNMIADVAPKGALSRIDPNDPMKAILEQFLSSASQASAEKFLRKLGVTIGHDPYLTGINRK